jgi:hypothetical protein
MRELLSATGFAEVCGVDAFGGNEVFGADKAGAFDDAFDDGDFAKAFAGSGWKQDWVVIEGKERTTNTCLKKDEGTT